eukprot:CAMPEP_0181500334 /NCGR_PEP_ID=MMETSP1110-20121109/55163_1 /TAXON_ID=174948 /ORGANISM="Symbiodinium sp., Strain CCMP421" /LENGTH=78 /DNA_ID=CAMNT_0023628633 /DNA_START=192 /DNA_END=428 /DNA_ORIENTATION=-
MEHDRLLTSLGVPQSREPLSFFRRFKLPLWLCLVKTLEDATLGVHEVGETLSTFTSLQEMFMQPSLIISIFREGVFIA